MNLFNRTQGTWADGSLSCACLAALLSACTGLKDDAKSPRDAGRDGSAISADDGGQGEGRGPGAGTGESDTTTAGQSGTGGGGRGGEGMDGGDPIADSGPMDDAGSGGRDPEMGSPIDAIYVLGSSCDRNGELGCSGHDRALTLLCAAGEWVQSGTCSGSERCDSRREATQGQCLDIVNECEDKRPGDAFCRGNDRMTCGPDRVTAESEPCPSDQVCVLQGQTARCEPDPDECATGDSDCDDDPQACVNTFGSFMCQCPNGYEGDGEGPNGCSDVEECATDNGGCDQSPLATCHEVIGGSSTCSCPDGYEGSGAGNDGCADIDECAAGVAAACGQGATACDDDDGGFACECGHGYVLEPGGQRCRERSWGTAERIEDNAANGASTAYPPALAIDGSGRVTAAWSEHDGMRDNIWANRYANGSWGSARLIENDDVGNATQPSLAADDAGNVLAIWEQYDQTGSPSVRANRFADDDWVGVSMLESSNNGTGAMDLAMESTGDAIAIWVQYDDGASLSVFANRYTRANGWSTASPIETSDGHAGVPSIALDGEGDAIAVWEQTDGSRYNIWSNRYDSGNLGTAERLEEDNTGDASGPKVAVNQDGVAAVVWFQQTAASSFQEVYLSFYRPGFGWADPIPLEVSDNGDALHPRVAIDDAGNAIAVWYQWDGMRYNAWYNRYDVEESWSGALLLETHDSGSASRPDIAIDHAGNAMAVWSQTIGSGGRSDVWARYFNIDSGWGEPTLLETTDDGDAVNCVIAVDLDGNFVAAWRQSDGIRYDIWSNRFE